jgi:hypothetical protein
MLCDYLHHDQLLSQNIVNNWKVVMRCTTLIIKFCILSFCFLAEDCSLSNGPRRRSELELISGFSQVFSHINSS